MGIRLRLERHSLGESDMAMGKCVVIGIIDMIFQVDNHLTVDLTHVIVLAILYIMVNRRCSTKLFSNVVYLSRRILSE